MPGKYNSAKAHNERYKNSASEGKGVMGHASKVEKIDPMPDYDISRVQYEPMSYKDTPKQAFDYKY